MAELKQLTPFVPVKDMDSAITFFCETLGFDLGFRGYEPDYAFLKRDRAALRLLNGPPGADLDDEARQIAVYIDVDDVDALYTELKPKLDLLPPARVNAPDGAPFDRFYGQREFHVSDDGPLLIMFGSPIEGHPGQRQTPSRETPRED